MPQGKLLQYNLKYESILHESHPGIYMTDVLREIIAHLRENDELRFVFTILCYAFIGAILLLLYILQ